VHQIGAPRTIPQVVEQAAERFGDREGLVDGDLRLSFAEVAERVDGAARALLATGVQPGDRVAVWAPNAAEWLVAALGAHRAGGAVVPLNTRLKGPEAQDIVERSGARLLFTVTDFLDTDYVALLDSAGRPGCLEEVVVLRGTAPAGTTAFDAFLARAAQVDPATSAAAAAAVDPDAVANIMFTSGTTGRPKGAMLRHEATIRAYTAWSEVVGLRDTDRYLIINPFFHSFGLNAGILACLIQGATILPHPVFDVPSVMRM